MSNFVETSTEGGDRPGRNLSEFGERIFIQGARRYGASTVAQGLYLAVSAIKEHADLEQVESALFSDQDRISRIARTANTVHEFVVKKRRKKPLRNLLRDNPPKDLTPDEARETIARVLGIAKDFSSYSLDDLEKMLRLYPKVLRPGGNPEDDIALVKGRLERSIRLRERMLSHTDNSSPKRRLFSRKTGK